MPSQQLLGTDTIAGMATTRTFKQPPGPPDVMTIDDLSLYLWVSKSSLYKLTQGGNVPSQKVGKHWRCHREAIDRWLSEKARSSRKGTKP